MMSLTMEFESDIYNQLLQYGVRWLHHPKMQSVEFSLYINKLLSWPIQIRSQELGVLKSLLKYRSILSMNKTGFWSIPGQPETKVNSPR